MACQQTPKTPEEQALQRLIDKRTQLLEIVTSGVLEIEQPQLGRTQFRSLDEVAAALQLLDDLIAAAGGGGAATNGQVWQKRRRPIYPVVTEI